MDQLAKIQYLNSQDETWQGVRGYEPYWNMTKGKEYIRCYGPESLSGLATLYLMSDQVSPDDFIAILQVLKN